MDGVEEADKDVEDGDEGVRRGGTGQTCIWVRTGAASSRLSLNKIGDRLGTTNYS